MCGNDSRQTLIFECSKQNVSEGCGDERIGTATSEQKSTNQRGRKKRKKIEQEEEIIGYMIGIFRPLIHSLMLKAWNQSPRQKRGKILTVLSRRIRVYISFLLQAISSSPSLPRCNRRSFCLSFLPPPAPFPRIVFRSSFWLFNVFFPFYCSPSCTFISTFVPFLFHSLPLPLDRSSARFLGALSFCLPLMSSLSIVFWPHSSSRPSTGQLSRTIESTPDQASPALHHRLPSFSPRFDNTVTGSPGYRSLWPAQYDDRCSEILQEKNQLQRWVTGRLGQKCCGSTWV